MSFDPSITQMRAPSETLLGLQQHRLRQILWLLLASFAAVLLINLFKQRFDDAGMMLGILVFLLLAYRWNQRGRLVRAAWCMVVSLMLGLSGLMLVGQGLFDEASMAYPALLVFAGLFGSRRLLQVLTGLMVLNFLLLYALDLFQLRPSIPLAASPIRVFNLSLVVVVCSFLVWQMVSDLRRMMARLETEKQALQSSYAQIEYLALRDGLTGLPNRISAKSHLGQLLQEAQASGRPVAVLLLDLDNFKTINDSLGHAAGDRLLCQVADALGLCVGPAGLVARAAGDEYIILIGDLPDALAVPEVVGRLFQALDKPFTLEGLEVLVTASIGIAVSPLDGEEVETLLKHADLAMHRAKEVGRNTFHRFEASMSEHAVEHLKIASRLRLALSGNELELHFQPQIDLARGRIVGAEALLRWRHPEWGYVPPARFIPVAERSGLIHELGNRVLEQACVAAQRWRELGLGELSVAINVAPLQFQRDDFEARVCDALAANRLPAHALELELTESSLLADAHHLSGVLQQLSATGVKIAIDDFGTGYSNLGYLRQYAVDRLKIDQSFVRRMCSDAHDEGLVRAIIEMAHCLELEVVAEGVEDVEALARLRAFGCEVAQGYHWSPALPMDAFVDFVRAHQPGPAAPLHAQPG
ncbi:MAG: EAL domain-containing protein [Xanthomonadaceae bacterium]|nr:EAL domain-containing protein [Xanthomonadaceae bacterium]